MKTIALTIVFVILVGCASGPVTVQDKMDRMHACQRVGGHWITSAKTPVYEGRCNWTPNL